MVGRNSTLIWEDSISNRFAGVRVTVACENTYPRSLQTVV